MGIGVDIVDVDRVISAYEKPGFAEKYYTSKERELIATKRSRAATCFAGKEAVVKALGTGFSGVMPSDIEILRDEAGKPIVQLHNHGKEIAEDLGITNISISLSDTENQAIAYTIATGVNEYEKNN